MRYIYILCIVSLLSGCSSTSKMYLENNDICHYNDSIFKVSKEDLIINNDLLQEIKARKKDTVLVDNEFFKNQYRYSIYSKSISNQQTNKLINIAKSLYYNIDGQLEWVEIEYINPYIKIFKEFYYDEQGAIEKVIDHEKGYNICWSEAIEIVKKIAKRDIKKYEVTGFNLQRANIKDFPDARPIWRISLDGNEEYERKPTKVYKIDGVTGEFLGTYKIEMDY